MATGFAFEITAIENLTARVVLRDGDATFQVACHSLIGFDGLGQFLQAVSVVVSERLWGAVCHWAGGQNDGWLVDVRTGSAWYEVTVFPEGEDWPPAERPGPAVFRARINDELNLARVVAAAYTSVLERYGAARYAELWNHPVSPGGARRIDRLDPARRRALGTLQAAKRYLRANQPARNAVACGDRGGTRGNARTDRRGSAR